VKNDNHPNVTAAAQPAMLLATMPVRRPTGHLDTIRAKKFTSLIMEFPHTAVQPLVGATSLRFRDIPARAPYPVTKPATRRAKEKIGPNISVNSL